MGFYSFGHINIISRNKIKTAVATAAYHAAIKLQNEYDGVTHDHSRKKNVGDTFIRLPESAPDHWRDESIPAKERLGVIWNEIEMAHLSANARLARANFIALPHNLTLEQGLQCIDRFIEENCTARGMGVTYSVHHKPGNLHVDLMYMINEYDKKGKPIIKSKKEYLCRNKDGRELYMDAETLKKAEGYEKVYKYVNGSTVEKMTPSEASELEGWERKSRDPISRKVQTGGFDEKDLAKKWRKSWEVILNDKYKELGMHDRVDCRSFAERGITHLPTIHEGWGPGKEKRQEWNKKIREYNSNMDELSNTGIFAIELLQGQVNDLQNNEQTEERIAEHEDLYRLNEKTLTSLIESKVLSAGMEWLFKTQFDDLRKKIKDLIQSWREYFRSRQNENMSLSEPSERADQEIKKSLDSQIFGADNKRSDGVRTFNREKQNSKDFFDREK